MRSDAAHGVSGFIVDNVEEAVQAVARIGDIDRAQCRRAFEARFTATRMADDYLRVYERLIAGTGMRAAVPASDSDADAQVCG